ncbi:MAG: TRAP transporter large permease subunit [Granulosicoccus sp.]|nr:TRAP transporter large permease subunit [Granulosicoccus sp.]
MELLFLAMLLVTLAAALGSGYPVAFALPGAAIVTICTAAVAGYVFGGSVDAYFAQGGPSQWLSAGVTNLRGIYWEVERDTLIAIPLFIFMGIMLQRSKIAEDLLVTMSQLFGPVPGGLGISVVFVGALLAATTGIVGATVVAMGLISLPVMLRNGYSQSLATGTISASGTLGQIIPPSIVLIILADQLASATDQAGTARKLLHKEATGELTMPSEFAVTSTSAGEMFLGALVPGLVLVGLYMAYILIFALLRPKSAPAVRMEGAYDARFALKVVGTLVPPLALIFLVLGSIITGIATVNQAGAIGAAGALLMASYRLKDGKRKYWPALLAMIAIGGVALSLSLYDTNIKNIKTAEDQQAVLFAVIVVSVLILSLLWSGIRVYRIDNTLHEVMIETAKATSLVFIILLGAAMLTAAFRAFGGEELVRDFLNGLPGGFWTKFVIVMAVIFILGFFLDFIEIAVVVVPIVAPILLADPQANITAVWLGVMIGLNIQTSFLTPPFGFALFYLRGVAPAIVKTINMYKGVIAFICLQLIALGIVGYFPSLVNYLPNRLSLLSETAPPPRNPKLQYCIEQFTTDLFASNQDQYQSALSQARALDLSSLPESLADDFEDSLDSASQVPELLTAVLQAEQAAIDNQENYRPYHSQVRNIQAGIRDLQERAEALRVSQSRISGADAETRKQSIGKRIDTIESEIQKLNDSIPAQWEEENARHLELQKAETMARNAYRKAADQGYLPAGELAEILSATASLRELDGALPEMKRLIQSSEPADLIDPLAELADQFGDIAGASDIDSAVSKARSALKKKTPDPEAALESIDKAIKEYEEQMQWRSASEQDVLPGLLSYEEVMRGSIGIRQQDRLTREQALSVASCSSHHRDISLNF